MGKKKNGEKSGKEKGKRRRVKEWKENREKE